MRIPMLPNYGAMPGGGIAQSMNALAQLQQQMAQAKYANPIQQGIANQELGAGQNALAQGANSPEYWQGQAAIQQGIGQQEQAGGAFAMLQQAAQTQQLQQQVLTTQITNKYLPLIQKAQAAGNVIPVLNQYVQELKSAGISGDLYQKAIDQMYASMNIYPNAPKVQVGPGSLPSNIVPPPRPGPMTPPVTTSPVQPTTPSPKSTSGKNNFPIGYKRAFKNPKDGTYGMAQWDGQKWHIMAE